MANGEWRMARRPRHTLGSQSLHELSQVTRRGSKAAANIKRDNRDPIVQLFRRLLLQYVVISTEYRVQRTADCVVARCSYCAFPGPPIQSTFILGAIASRLHIVVNNFSFEKHKQYCTQRAQAIQATAAVPHKPSS